METENAVLKKSEDHYFEEASKKKKMMNILKYKTSAEVENYTT